MTTGPRNPKWRFDLSLVSYRFFLHLSRLRQAFLEMLVDVQELDFVHMVLSFPFVENVR